MTIYRSTKFESLYKKLPPDLRRKVDIALDRWSEDVTYPSLNWKLVSTKDRWWSIRIGPAGHRAVCEEVPDDDNPDEIDHVWFFVGAHDDYIRLLP